jgi:hypothetical protein
MSPALMGSAKEIWHIPNIRNNIMQNKKINLPFVFLMFIGSPFLIIAYTFL